MLCVLERLARQNVLGAVQKTNASGSAEIANTFTCIVQFTLNAVTDMRVLPVSDDDYNDHDEHLACRCYAQDGARWKHPVDMPCV